MKNHMNIEITIPSQTRYLSLIGRIGENLAQELGEFTHDTETLGQHLNVVLTEALVNAIKHANAADATKEVIIRICVSGRELLISVYDNGKGFDLNSVPCEECPEPLGEQGRGIFIIRSLMDSVEYKKISGGNVLEMKKRLD
jgi:serine/threonine-protein kinase RsbW